MLKIILRSIAVFTLLVSFAACASFSAPADPANNWAAGFWSGETSTGSRHDIDVKVGDKNKLAGTVATAVYDGRRGSGSIAGEVNGDQVVFSAMYSSSSVEYTLTRQEDGSLRGVGNDGVNKWRITFKKK
jgi:hypothetical protein